MRVAVVLLLIAASLPARAQLRDTKGLAKQHLDDGLVYYNARKYDQAIDEWRQAYLLDADVNTLFAIGQAQRLKGDCEAAAETYRTVLRETLPPKQAAEVGRVLKICEDKLKTGAPAPPPAAAEPTPDDDSPTEEPAAAAAAAPEEPTPSPARPDEPSPWYTDWIGDGLAGLAVVGLASGATFWFLAQGAADDAEASPRYDDFSGHADRARLDRKIMVGSFIASGLFAVGAAIRWSARDVGGGGATVGASVAPGGGVFTLEGSF